MGSNQTQLSFQPSGDSSSRCDSQRVFNNEGLHLFSPALQTRVLEDSNPGRGRGRGVGFRRFGEYFDGLCPGGGGDEEDSRKGMYLSRAVCLVEFQENQNLRFLPECCHAFHIDCIDMWLRSHADCPLYRSNFNGSSANIGLLDEISSVINSSTEITS